MRLSKLLKDWRWANKLSVRDAAKQLGVSHGTWARLENGENMDGRTLSRILTWMLEPDNQPKKTKENGQEDN